MAISLEDVAKHINWYSDPQRLLANTSLFLSQVMARGSAADIIAVQQHYSPEAFKSAYLNAPAGLFTKRAWAYWGLMLLGHSNQPMPERFAGANQLNWRGPIAK